MIVRGICCLRPGLPGISENIRVISIVGRFLEHSRVYYFENGSQPEVYVGSADLMPRNLDRRVEVLFPIKDPTIRAYLRYALLEVELNDNTRARELLSNGSYVCREPPTGEPVVDSQAWLMAHPAQSGARSALSADAPLGRRMDAQVLTKDGFDLVKDLVRLPTGRSTGGKDRCAQHVIIELEIRVVPGQLLDIVTGSAGSPGPTGSNSWRNLSSPCRWARDDRRSCRRCQSL